MAAYVSVQSGNWDDVATWGGGGYPSVAGDTAVISNGDEVIYNINSIVELGAITINYGGTLRFARSMNTCMRLGNAKVISVQGNFYCGNDESEPIEPNYTAIIEYAYTGNQGGAMTVGVNGKLRMFGSPNYQPTRYVKLVADWTSGQVITVQGDVSTQWRIGDELHVERYGDVAYLGSTNGQVAVTIASMILNGGNTEITINEAFSNNCMAGAYAVNLNSHNIIFRKVGPATGINTYNNYSPGISCTSSNDWWTEPAVKLNNVLFHNFYYVNVLYNLLVERCLFRNNQWAIYTCNNSNIKNSIFCSSGTQRTSYNCKTSNWNNCFVIGTAALDSASYWMTYNDCIFIGFSSTSESWGPVYKNCIFRTGTYFSSDAREPLFEKCSIYYTYGLIRNDNVRLIRCNYRYDENGNYIPCVCTDFYYDYGMIGVYMKDCKMSWNNGLDEPNTDGRRNARYHWRAGNIHVENFNEVEGDNRIYYQFGSAFKDASVKLNASCSLRVSPSSFCGESVPMIDEEPCQIEIVKWTEHNVPAVYQSRSVYMFPEGWTSYPTSTELYLEAEYYDGALGWTTTKVKSTAIFYELNWREFQVSFTPGRVGPVTYRVVLAKYEAGAKVYLDHGLRAIIGGRYYFTEALFNWGESVLPAPNFVELPEEGNVYNSIPYGTLADPKTGAMILPEENQVKDAVEYGDPADPKTGNVVLPSEDDVREGVGFGAYE